VIPKHHYFAPDIFDVEAERLFRTGWHFACLAPEVANDRDFVCVDYPGAAIVIQNFKGALKAFQNVCTHRFNKIQTEERGNRPLTCGYHAWSFDSSGFPAGMPRKAQVLEGNASRESLCLTQYRVELCGKFVFIGLGSVDGSLRDHLGPFYGVLEEISRHIGGETHFGSVPHAVNWKLLVENVVECYHCAVAHTETFIPAGFGKLPIDQVEISGSHSSCHFPRQADGRDGLRKRMFSHLAKREFSHDSFYHIYIFPNLFIASTEGMSFYVGHAIPVGPEQSVLRLRYLEPNVDFSAGQRIRQDKIAQETNAIGLRLVEEDRTILQNVQKGIRIADKPGVIGADEVRVKAFMDAYLAKMAPPPAVRRVISS
jgi:phenylpropionate dioxygenase-like ring-hydroxylating dioxygenase large terminal subunit